MQQRVWFQQLICLGLLHAIFGSHLALADENVVVSSGPEWCPLICNGQTGFITDIVTAIYTKHGISLRYEESPWARSLQNVRTGKTAIITGLYANDAPDFLFPQEEVAIGQNCFYTHKDLSWHFDGIESLKHITLGVVNEFGYDDGKELDKYIADHRHESDKIHEAYADNGLTHNFNMLNANRIDALIDDKLVVDYFLKENHLEQAYKNVGCVAPINVYIAFSPVRSDSRALANIFDQELRAMRASGELKKILNKYGVQDWK